MKRHQAWHETFIPLLVEVCDARTYLELGSGMNETLSRVRCERRFGVDVKPYPLEDVTHFAMTTAEFIANCAREYAPYDIVFIDGDHAFESVSADFFGIWPYVSDEGLVLLHDTQPLTRDDTLPGASGTAWRAAQMVVGFFESVTLPYGPGLTIVRKRCAWGAVG